MYTIYLQRGTVVRDSDQHIVCPCQSVEDEDFIAYNEWIAAGGVPTIIETSPDE